MDVAAFKRRSGGGVAGGRGTFWSHQRHAGHDVRSSVRSRGFFVPVEPGPTPMPGNPIKMAGLGSDDWTPCPRLGDDNRAVLREWLDYDDARIAALEAAGVLVDKPPK